MSTATRTLAPCGTLAAHTRHRRRREPVDEACRDAANTYENDWRARKRAARRAAGNAKAMQDAARRPREIRVVRPPGGPIALGALAGTTIAHGHLPDMHTGTSCMACFGYVDDYRHTHRLWLGRGVDRG